MLGSLPSTYLNWISKNLRAGDTEEWARLADEVLADPVYRDRIEWEIAEKVLNGNTNNHTNSVSGFGRSNAVSELVEISGRFGWDNEDKQGWSEVDFGLLGTSRGGRIPRLANKAKKKNASEEKTKKIENVGMGDESGGRRRERMIRRRRRVKKIGETEDGGREGEGEGGSKDEPCTRPTLSSVDVVQRPSPFPGRQALLSDKRLLLRRNRHPPDSSSSSSGS